MSPLVQWLSATPASLMLREVDGLVLVLQSIHILAIAVVISSLLMLDLRVLARAPTQTLAETVHRFEAWIWTGLAVLAASGALQILAEPTRTLPNASFQLKLVLIALALAATYALRVSLRRGADRLSFARASLQSKLLAVSASLLWCAVAAAGRFIAYTQPA